MSEPAMPDFRDPSPEEMVRLRQFTNACGVLVSCVYKDIRDVEHRENGTGVLVRFGGRDFIFTAGHVIRGRRESEVAVHFPRALIVPRKEGDSIRRLTTSHHPDVGIIELDPADGWGWRHMVPVGHEASLDWREVRDDELVAVLGLPVVLQTWTELRPKPNETVGVGGVLAITVLQSGVKNDDEPEGGHGFHIFFSRVQQAYSDKAMRIEPKGMSGGPVVAIERGEPQLLGIVRANVQGHYLWCEPIRFVIELLLGHEDEAVVRDARKALAALGSRD